MIFTKVHRDGPASMLSTWSFVLITVYCGTVYDVPFYLRSSAAFTAVLGYGHELGSHSTSHSPNFGAKPITRFDFPVGDGTEQFDYMTGYSPQISCQRGNISSPVPNPNPTYEECRANWEYEKGTICDFLDGETPAPPGEKTCGYYQTRGGTILGDLRVSKFLVEQVYLRSGLDNKCVAFRPGHLHYPPQMGNILHE